MKAIAYLGDKKVFLQQDIGPPQVSGHDLLINIHAVALNPVDYKIRRSIDAAQSTPQILGWDAAGIVEQVGELVELFNVGDHVYYAGDITRPGCNATHQLVDERIVGHMPKSLDFEAAAALPLTSITAWEVLFERLKITASDKGKTILIIGAAGGVGSIAMQLASKVAHLNVIATASRNETREWCLSLGAHHVIDHHQDLLEQFEANRLSPPDYILCLNNTDHYFPIMAELIAPQGSICSIVEASEKHDIDLLKMKSASFVWEFMFTKSMFKTTDMIKQHQLLNDVAELVDNNTIKTTINSKPGEMTVDSITQSHQLLESGKAIGKIVLSVSED